MILRGPYSFKTLNIIFTNTIKKTRFLLHTITQKARVRSPSFYTGVAFICVFVGIVSGTFEQISKVMEANWW